MDGQEYIPPPFPKNPRSYSRGDPDHRGSGVTYIPAISQPGVVSRGSGGVLHKEKDSRIVRSSVVARFRIQFGGDGVRFVNKEGRSGQVRVRNEWERGLLFAMMVTLAGWGERRHRRYPDQDARS